MRGKRIYNTEEVASSLKISKQTLLRYEKKGIIPKARRNPINKWREFTEEDIKQIKKILAR